MPQVASDPKIHAPAQPFQRPARPSPSDRAPSPFESLLDDSTQGAEQPAPPSPGTKTVAADNSQAPAKSNDCKPPAAADNGNASKSNNPDPTDKPDDDGKSIGDGKADVNAKTAAAAGDGIKTTTDGDKPAEGAKADGQTVTPATGATQTVTTTDASAIVPVAAATPVQAPPAQNIDQPAVPAELSAILAEGAPNLKPVDANALKAGAGKHADAGKQADDDKAADANAAADTITDDSQPAIKTAPQLHTDKPQTVTSDNDKDHIAQARGEAPANNHRGEDTSAPVVSADATLAAPKAGTDSAQTAVSSTTQTTAPAAVNPVLAAPATPQAVPVPLADVAIEIAGKAMAGKNRFEIRLDPPELGRIDVRLDVDRDGNVTSRLTVDRAETLDLLRRDASGLERALQDAGLKTADNGLQFSLRDQSMGQQQMGGGSDTAQLVVKDDTLPPIDIIPQSYGRLAGQGTGLDIRV